MTTHYHKMYDNIMHGYNREWVRVSVMGFDTTFNNISVLLVEETGETTGLPQVTDKLDHIML